MKYNFLGNTGVLVSELCFGTMTFAGKGYWKNMGSVSQKEADHLLKMAIDGGINFIDTANVYSFGESEMMTGQSLRALGVNRHDVFLATKVRGRMGAAINNAGLSRLHIHRSVDESLQRLGIEHIDLLYIHGFDPFTPLEETMRGLHEVVQTGKVRYIGVCNIPAWQVMKANAYAEKMGWQTFQAMQYYYSVAGRDVEHELLPMAQSEHIGFMPWSPLAGGFLSGKYTRNQEKAGDSRRDTFDFPPVDRNTAFDIIEVMEGIAATHQVSVAQVALAWVIQQKGVTSIIIGAKRTEQLADNLAAVALQLSPEELQQMIDAGKMPQQYPDWMVERQRNDRVPPDTQIG